MRCCLQQDPQLLSLYLSVCYESGVPRLFFTRYFIDSNKSQSLHTISPVKYSVFPFPRVRLKRSYRSLPSYYWTYFSSVGIVLDPLLLTSFCHFLKCSFLTFFPILFNSYYLFIFPYSPLRRFLLHPRPVNLLTTC